MLHSTKKQVRLLVVDDSASVRRWLVHVLDQDKRLCVVGTAGSAKEARAFLRHNRVDLLTLDLEMSEESGLDFLERLMLLRPLPVVIFSSLSSENTPTALEALSKGAVDCIEKPRVRPTPGDLSLICDRIFNASFAHVSAGQAFAEGGFPEDTSTGFKSWKGPIHLIGGSTGGINALETVLGELEGCPAPVLVAQHMPENFLYSLARRLDDKLARRFSVAQRGAILEKGSGIIVLGKTVSTRLHRTSCGEIELQLCPPSSGTKHRPSIDDLFKSACSLGVGGTAAVLSGMGQDGAAGLSALKSAGFVTFAQDEASSTVFGMPNAAISRGAADYVLPPLLLGQKMFQYRANPNGSFVYK